MFVHLYMLEASNCSSVLMFVSFHDFRLPYWLLLVENHYLAALSSCNTLFILEPCWCRGKVLRWEAFYKLLIIFPCFRGAVNFTNDSPLMEFFLPLSPWTHLFYSIPNLFPWSLTLIDYDSFLIWCYRMAGSSEEGKILQLGESSGKAVTPGDKDFVTERFLAYFTMTVLLFPWAQPKGNLRFFYCEHLVYFLEVAPTKVREIPYDGGPTAFLTSLSC